MISFQEKNVGVNLEITNAIFTPDDQKINADFQQIARNIYGVDILPFDINHIPNAMKTINSYIAKATHNRIPNFVLESKNIIWFSFFNLM